MIFDVCLCLSGSEVENIAHLRVTKDGKTIGNGNNSEACIERKKAENQAKLMEWKSQGLSQQREMISFREKTGKKKTFSIVEESQNNYRCEFDPSEGLGISYHGSLRLRSSGKYCLDP